MSSITDQSITNTNDSAKEVKEYFDTYYSKKVSYNSNDVDAVVGFFRKRGFDNSAATATASVLLSQAKFEKINVFKLLDTLEGLSEVQISKTVSAVLNNKRSKTSLIGLTETNRTTTVEKRNIRL
jgi:ribosomal protein L7/L12